MYSLNTDKTWKYYGEKEPYYGVFGQDMYLTDNLNEQTLDDYFSSGVIYVEDLFATINAKIDKNFTPGNILDFGCGPGRFIIPFSRYAHDVVGVDISQHMLDEAMRNCRKFEVANASFRLSDDNLDFISDQEFDLVHSFIVLQHLKVKRGEKLIRVLLDSIKKNGVGVLHVTYHDHFPQRRIVNYFRNRIPYLATVLRLVRSRVQRKKFRNLPQMQMNSFNLNTIFQLLQDEKITEVFSTFTNHYNYYGITLYFKKP
jgi:ubiquinone/menaquinone biosynthesis C-methylase UbiE